MIQNNDMSLHSYLILRSPTCYVQSAAHVVVVFTKASRSKSPEVSLAGPADLNHKEFMNIMLQESQESQKSQESQESQSLSLTEERVRLLDSKHSLIIPVESNPNTTARRFPIKGKLHCKLPLEVSYQTKYSELHFITKLNL